MPNLKAWFIGQSDAARIVFLIKIMHWLSIDFRSFSDVLGPLGAWELAKKINEINHRISSYSSALLTGSSRYPDDVFFDVVFETLADEGLRVQLPLTWQGIDREAGVQS